MRHAQTERITFTGTGTFITRLMQSGLVRPEDLARKYASELHANEIMLLAYYIAAVNIETTYHALTNTEYSPFQGIVLTDTFQMTEDDDSMDTEMFPQNNSRIVKQLAAPIHVIVGNPPYSVGQDSANDLNANMAYPTLDKRIAETYAKLSTAGLKRNLYDSYVRAFRWATDRIGEAGVVGFVSNGGWLDSNTMDGMRLSLAGDYSAVYVYNLRGNQRTAGELSRKEGGKVFGSGSRNTVAILIAVKNRAHNGPCEIFYRDIGDYLMREQKLEIVAGGDLESVDWLRITPNDHGDWINQRNNAFAEWPVIGDKKAGDGVARVFHSYSLGLATNRDSWVYGYSSVALKQNVRRLIGNYNDQLGPFDIFCTRRGIAKRNEQAVTLYLGDNPSAVDERNIKWSSSMRQYMARGIEAVFDRRSVRAALYRPFNKQRVYFNTVLNERTGQLPSMFPLLSHNNFGMFVPTAGSSAPDFLCLMTDSVPDLGAAGISGVQFFPRWTYKKVDPDDGTLALDTGDSGSGDVDEHGYRRVDNITDGILKLYREAIGDPVTKDDIFFYVYGLLHDPVYREAYAADLKKMLPHIPTPQTRERFEQLASAGRALADLHVGYEDVEQYPVDVQLKPGADPTDRETWRVSKLKWAKKKDPDTGKSVHDVTKLIYNTKVTITGIPEEAERYMLGSRSALAWVIDRYQVKTDKASGIVNDPNDWCDEHDDPRYIVDLIAKVTTVAVKPGSHY